jgi:hypothetical protein
MSATAKVGTLNAAKTKPVVPGQSYLVGKIVDVENIITKDKRKLIRTRLIMKNPSGDEFSYPMPFDLITDQPIGAKGEHFDGVVNLSTYRGDWETPKDPETGEFKKIKEIKLTCYLPD